METDNKKLQFYGIGVSFFDFLSFYLLFSAFLSLSVAIFSKNALTRGSTGSSN